MQVKNPPNIIRLLTPQRLTPYYYNGAYNDYEALRRYRFNVDLSATVYEAIAVFEVILRNSVCLSWQSHLSDPNWPWSKSGIPSTYKYQKTIDEIDKAEGKVLKRKTRGTITSGDIISEMTFGTWLHFFDSKFDYTNNLIFNKIFPHLVDPDPNIKNKVFRVRGELELIWKLRNRISHHEPIFHLKDLVTRYELITKLIHAIDPECAALHDKYSFYSVLHRGW